MARILVNLLQSTGTKGGIEIYARELYTQLGGMDSGHEFVGLASRELAAKGADWFPGRLIDSGISGENRFAWARGELFGVSRFARREGVDLIHGPAMFGPLRSSIPVVISIHDLLYFSHPELMQTKLFTGPVKWMERRGAAGAARFITISQFSARAIQKYLGVPADRIDVIPLAGRATATGVHTRPADGQSLFLAMGQRSPYKDFPTVIRAWSHIPEASRPRLVVTGSHGDDPLMPLVAELGLERWVDLKSWVSNEELAQLLGSATALIDSTLATGFSMPTLESMAIGLPTLLADNEILREVGGEAADYFAPGDPIDLARAVQQLASDPARQDELSTLGLARAATFSWEKVAVGTLETFDRVLSERAARS